MEHANDAAVQHMIRQRNYKISVNENVNNQTCEPCVSTKQFQAPFNGSSVHTTRNIAVHVDICSPISV